MRTRSKAKTPAGLNAANQRQTIARQKENREKAADARTGQIAAFDRRRIQSSVRVQHRHCFLVNMSLRTKHGCVGKRNFVSFTFMMSLKSMPSSCKSGASSSGITFSASRADDKNREACLSCRRGRAVPKKTALLILDSLSLT